MPVQNNCTRASSLTMAAPSAPPARAFETFEGEKTGVLLNNTDFFCIPGGPEITLHNMATMKRLTWPDFLSIILCLAVLKNPIVLSDTATSILASVAPRAGSVETKKKKKNRCATQSVNKVLISCFRFPRMAGWVQKTRFVVKKTTFLNNSHFAEIP